MLKKRRPLSDEKFLVVRKSENKSLGIGVRSLSRGLFRIVDHYETSLDVGKWLFKLAWN